MSFTYDGPTMKQIAYNHARANLEDCMCIHEYSDSVQVWQMSDGLVLFVGILEPRDEEEALTKINDVLRVDIKIRKSKLQHRRRQITFTMNWQDYIREQLSV